MLKLYFRHMNLKDLLGSLWKGPTSNFKIHKDFNNSLIKSPQAGRETKVQKSRQTFQKNSKNSQTNYKQKCTQLWQTTGKILAQADWHTGLTHPESNEGQVGSENGGN